MNDIVKFVLLSLLMFGVKSFGQNVPFYRLGSPFQTQTNISVSWNAPKSDLPHKFWIYKALPAKVSSDVISNLVALGSFTEKDREKIPGYPRLIAYDDPSGKKSLRVNPDWVFIEYSDPDADDMHNTNGVPSRQQAIEMAKHWLPILGIDSRQLAQNTDGTGIKIYGGPETVFFYPKEAGPAYATNICMQIVTFMRALDGIEISGGCARGGGCIQFGHDTKISKIMVSWRNYKRDKLYPAATPEMLLKWIREGKAVWRSKDDSMFPDWSSVKNIVITKATLYYYSEAYDENDKPQNAACPFVEMEAVANAGTTNLIFNFDCPIIDETQL